MLHNICHRSYQDCIKLIVGFVIWAYLQLTAGQQNVKQRRKSVSFNILLLIWLRQSSSAILVQVSPAKIMIITKCSFSSDAWLAGSLPAFVLSIAFGLVHGNQMPNEGLASFEKQFFVYQIAHIYWKCTQKPRGGQIISRRKSDSTRRFRVNHMAVLLESRVEPKHILNHFRWHCERGLREVLRGFVLSSDFGQRSTAEELDFCLLVFYFKNKKACSGGHGDLGGLPPVLQPGSRFHMISVNSVLVFSCLMLGWYVGFRPCRNG